MLVATRSMRKRIGRSFMSMIAATLLGTLVPTPARAEAIDLLCTEGAGPNGMHVSIDTDRKTVVYSVGDKHYGPFVASISATFISWIETATNYESRYDIDRVAGTFRNIVVHRDLHADFRGQCRRATQKF